MGEMLIVLGESRPWLTGERSLENIRRWHDGVSRVTFQKDYMRWLQARGYSVDNVYVQFHPSDGSLTITPLPAVERVVVGGIGQHALTEPA